MLAIAWGLTISSSFFRRRTTGSSSLRMVKMAKNFRILAPSKKVLISADRCILWVVPGCMRSSRAWGSVVQRSPLKRSSIKRCSSFWIKGLATLMMCQKNLNSKYFQNKELMMANFQVGEKTKSQHGEHHCWSNSIESTKRSLRKSMMKTHWESLAQGLLHTTSFWC